MQWAFKFYDQNSDGVIDITDIFSISSEIGVDESDSINYDMALIDLPASEDTKQSSNTNVSKYIKMKALTMVTPSFMNEIRMLIDDYMNRIVKQTPGVMKRPLNQKAFNELIQESVLANEIKNKLKGDSTTSILVQACELKKENKKEVKAKPTIKRAPKKELPTIKE